MAHGLLRALWRIGLADTAFADAACGILRLEPLAIGALVRVSVRRLASAVTAPPALQASRSTRELCEKGCTNSSPA